MGFFGFKNLGQFVQDATLPALQVATGRAQGQLLGNQLGYQRALQSYAIQRQQQQDALNNAFLRSRIGATDALTNSRNNPRVTYRMQPDENGNVRLVPTSGPQSVMNQLLGQDEPALSNDMSGPSFNASAPTNADLTQSLRGGPSAAPSDTTPPVPTALPPAPSGVRTINTGIRVTPKVAPAPKTLVTASGIKQWNPATQQWEDTGLAGNNQNAPKTLNTAQGVRQWNPVTKQWESTGLTPYQAPDRALVVTTDDNGNRTYTPRPQAAGKNAPVSGQGGMGQVRMAAAQSGVAQMENADQAMQPYESLLSSGKANITGLDQFGGKLAQAFSQEGVKGTAAQAIALSQLNKVNPDLARYLRRGLEFAQGESQVTGRPSDFRTKLSDFLSTAGANASPQMVADVQNTRSTIVKPLRQALGGQTVKYTPPGGGAGQASQQQQLWDAAVAKYGEAKVLQEYGPRPPE